MKKQRRAIERITVITVFFCLACFIFVIRLLVLQVFSRDKYAPAISSNTYKRETVIEAQRGDICDRNGKVLVTNRYTYNLILDYYALPPTVREENEAILGILEQCRRNGVSVKLCDNFPLTGTYPDMKYVQGTEKERKSIIEHYYCKDSISPEKLAKFLADRYDLLGDDGKTLVCTPEQALDIMRVRWSMISADFYNTGEYVLAENITRELAVSVSESNIKGCTVKTVSTREYKYRTYASHILGQLGKIYSEDWDEYKKKGYSMDAMVGISGCENVFEDYLRGKDGILVTEYDKKGVMLKQYVKKEPSAGHDVWLTIDIDMQMAAEDGLVENIEYIKSSANRPFSGEDAKAGAFCMVDVNNGQVLAMASNPTFDLSTFNKDYNELSKDENSPLTNRVIDGLYAPGSTFKPGVALAALDEGIIEPGTIINTKGKYTYFKDYQPRCWYYISTGRSHGPINVSEALRVSCNYFFYDVGRQLGIDKMNEYCKKYGLGQETGFELGGKTGILAGPEYRKANSLEAWKETDTIVAAIGQSENLFSPLQMSVYFAALANGGTRYAPTILYAVKDFYTDADAAEMPAPKVMSRFEMTGENRQTLMSALRSVVSSSYALTNKFRVVPVDVAGKTGTAQVGPTKSENALFAGYAPADNPEVAAVCVIEQGHAGTSASYTVARVFEKYFNKKNNG